MPVERLEAQLSYLVARGYRGATFTEAVLSRPSGPTLVVTFDDGYRSVAQQAFPVMAALGLPGTMFVTTSWVDCDGPMTRPSSEREQGREQELRHLSWDDARRLVESGWEIGSHTITHPRLTECDDDALLGELAASRAVCEEQIGHCRAVAYPYGDVDSRVVAAAERAGYETGAGLPGRLHGTHPLNWPRIGVYAVDDTHRFRSKVSRGRRHLVGRRAGEKAIRAEQRLRGLIDRPL